MEAFGVHIPVVNDGYMILATGDYLDPVARLFCPLGHTPETEGRPIRPGDLAAECVALSLAGVARFGGQTLPTKLTAGLTDAQHAFHVAEVLAERRYPVAMIWQGLHHDDGESFGLGSDVPAPIKRKYPEVVTEIRKAQDELLTAICWSLRVPSWVCGECGGTGSHCEDCQEFEHCTECEGSGLASDVDDGAWATREKVWTQHPIIKEADQAAYALETVFMPRSSRWPARRDFGDIATNIERRGLLTSIEAAAAWLSVHIACVETIKRHGFNAQLPWPDRQAYVAARHSLLALSSAR